MVTFSDPLFARQWHFKLMGDIGTIWNQYSGAGVSIGVYDTGIQYTHPDLNGNYDPALHFVYNGVTYDPYPINVGSGPNNDGHGTSVAGLIAGEAGNRIGGVGVAWGATLTGVNLLSDPVFFDNWEAELAAYLHAASFDIMSNSWGYNANFNSFLNRADPSSIASSSEAAFGYTAQNGRGGLGTVIVKAAGNDGTNANAEGINGSRFVIDVAALTSTGAVTSYSNFGTNILVSAAAASVTTDLTGSGGYNRSAGAAGNYLTDFGGTSASAALVTGVVALMMDANENLGWRDVREILATSAALTGSVVNGRAGYETMSIASQNSGNWNGGGHAFSNDYGFGRLDAFAAVRMAEAWALFSDVPKTSGNEQTVTASTDDGFSSPLFSNGNRPALTVGEAMWIDHIDVTISFSLSPLNTNGISYLAFALIAPDGTRFQFLNSDQVLVPENGIVDLSAGFSWTFGISQALGLSSVGTWQLEDSGEFAGGESGTVTDFTLDFYGSAPDATGADVHHITKDFLRVTAAGAAGWNGGRDRIITDGNGGIDWLNMSSIAGAINITLDSLGKILVGGVQWATIGLGEMIENLITGDGADKIVGSALSNEFHGMRGNDIIYGSAGLDSLYGGTGADLVFGGVDADVVYGDGGNDTLDGGIGDDTVYGGAGSDRIFEKTDGGNDVVYGGSGRDSVALGAGDDIFFDEAEFGISGGDTVTGGAGNDTLNGDGGADSLSGDGGDDSIVGGGGNDTLAGGLGIDVIDGGIGNDLIAGGDGDDALTGAAGFDKLFGDAGNDILLAGDGNDTATGGLGSDSIDGGEGADSLLGGYGLDTLLGGIGNDKLFGDAGDDTIFAGDGNDAGSGGLGNDVIDGGEGLDAISGGDGLDAISGGNGDDKLFGDAGNDTISGDAGNDFASGGLGNDLIDGGDGVDALYGGSGWDTVSGGNGNDKLFGEAGNDTLLAGDGNDAGSGGLGNDSIDGGEGLDTLLGGDGLDTLLGGNGDDKLFGEAGADLLSGGDGNDSLAGGAGADRIEGGAGNDTLTGSLVGGLDADTFVFNAGFGTDRVTDFRDNVDTLAFAAELWGDITTAADFVTTYAHVLGNSIVFDFLDGNMVTVAGLRPLTSFYDDVAMI